MKNKVFTIVAVVLVVPWLLFQYKATDAGHKAVMSRLESISLMRTRIEDIDESMKIRADETVSNADLNDAIEIGRLEREIGNLRMENAIAECEDGMFWRMIQVIVFVLVFTQSGASGKKLNIRQDVT